MGAAEEGGCDGEEVREEYWVVGGGVGVGRGVRAEVDQGGDAGGHAPVRHRDDHHLHTAAVEGFPGGHPPCMGLGTERGCGAEVGEAQGAHRSAGGDLPLDRGQDGKAAPR